MTSPVRIDAEAWGDLRFATLARLLGLRDSDHALIKVARIWSWQTEHYTPAAPTYVVDQDTIESALGEGGAAALVRARLAEEVPDGFRIKGTQGRIEWLYKKRQSSARGGEATRRKWSADTDPEAGRPALECNPGNERGPTGQPTGPVTARPAPRPTLGALTPVPDLLPDQIRDQNSLSLRAIGSAGIHGTGATRTPYAIAKGVWDRVSAARVELAAELQLANVRPMPDRYGMPSEPRACHDLRDRLREEGDNAADVADHVVANLIAQAREERTVEWLSEKAFSAGGWQTARNWLPKQQLARRGPARAPGGLIGSASPRTDHPDSPTLVNISEL